MMITESVEELNELAKKNYGGVTGMPVNGEKEIDPFCEFDEKATPYWLRDDNDEQIEKHRRLVNLQQRSHREYGQSVGRDNILWNEKPKSEAPFYLLDEKK